MCVCVCVCVWCVCGGNWSGMVFDGLGIRVCVGLSGMECGRGL